MYKYVCGYICVYMCMKVYIGARYLSTTYTNEYVLINLYCY